MNKPTRASEYGGILIGLLMFIVSIFLCLITYLYASYEVGKTMEANGVQTSSTSGPAAKKIPSTPEEFEKSVQGMKETNDLFINWSIIIFGGTIGIAILGQGAKIRDRNSGLVFIPPTWILLYMSLIRGTRFKEHLTFQQMQGAYLFRELNADLYLQQEFFRWSLYALAFLAMWYLCFRFSSLEERPGE